MSFGSDFFSFLCVFQVAGDGSCFFSAMLGHFDWGSSARAQYSVEQYRLQLVHAGFRFRRIVFPIIEPYLRALYGSADEGPGPFSYVDYLEYMMKVCCCFLSFCLQVVFLSFYCFIVVYVSFCFIPAQ